MYFLFINLLTICALFDSKYHKIRFDILIILLFVSTIFWIEKSNKAKLITEILLITLGFSIFYITNHFFYKNSLFIKKPSPTILSSGDKILFLSIMLISGIEKGLIIILFGLLVTLIWEIFTRKPKKSFRDQIRTMPLYPFMAFSFILIGMINL